MNRFLRRVLFALLLGVLVYGAFVVYSGISAVRASLGGFHWWTFAAALGLATFNYVLRFAKWEYYLARLDVRGVPKLESFLVFLSGFVLTVTPGKVGEVFKSAVLAETHEVPMPRTAPIVIAERLTDVIAVILLIALGSVGFQNKLK
ncbi:MAG: lysylphosphatidylglycerol synthase domain-containing protein [Polyangiaceae bacterium]